MRCEDVVVEHAVIEVDTRGRVQRWSAGAETLFGYRAADVLGASVGFLVPEHLRDAHWAGFHRAMRNPKVRDMAADLPVVCSDGQVRIFAGRLLVLSDALGQALGALAIYAAPGTTGHRPFG